MKKILLFVAFTLSFVFMRAQQDPQYSQFFLNKLAFNPGFTGTEEKICVTGQFRSQWLGWSNSSGLNADNAVGGQSNIGSSPQTIVGNIHSPLGNHFGVGLNISNDQIGFMSFLNATLSLSYRYTFNDGSLLSGGVGGGFMQQIVDGTKFKPHDQGDPIIPTQSTNGLAPDFSFGAYYKKPSLWIFDDIYGGISLTHLNQATITLTSGNSRTQMRLHDYLVMGAVYNGFGPALAIEPNILFKYDQAKMTTDINVMAMYNNKFRGGLTYRTIDAIVLLVGYKITPDLQVGLSYDFTTSRVRDYSNGTVEVLIKYCFMPKFETKPVPPLIPRLTPRFL